MEALVQIAAVVVEFVMVGMLLIILSYGFWLWMFIHAVKQRKTAWIILLLISLIKWFLPGITALIYFFAVYLRKNKLNLRDIKR